MGIFAYPDCSECFAKSPCIYEIVITFSVK
jgi:hypothetical protein